ncbi:MAG: VOC family protein [Candidatus Bathyarchaeota archaeon]|nr:MAG: VOC family protein [Candidatus Bathyarchaeota archaeon]
MSTEPLFRKIDCVRLHVTDLEDALSFYRERLGHQLTWRTEGSAGLRMPETDAEIVLQTEREGEEIDLLVDSAYTASKRFEDSGGEIVVPPFDIAMGRCSVVRDPWGNELVLLDASKGRLTTDADGNVIGVEK